MNIQTYLNRINYAGSIEPTAETLKNLQQAHLLSVPFENLDIHLNRPIILNEELVYKKVILQNRGGFCYELNRMFGWLLENLGFNVTLLSSRSVSADGKLGIEHDHLMLMARCPADNAPESNIPWLADVGWGDGFLYPKRLDQLNSEQPDGPRAHTIEEVEDSFFVMSQRGYDGIWAKQYRFNLKAHRYSEYESACQYHQTSPHSHFPKKRVCTMATPSGRMTLTEEKFVETVDGIKSERPISPDQFEPILASRFGITLINPIWK